jgi:cytochrome c biogenesis protein CcmG/thiol:disulfide interchange protein DsbE
VSEGPEVPGGRRRARLALWIALGVGSVVALLVAVLATSNSADQVEQQAASPLQGKPAPEIAGTLLSGGSSRLSDYRGRWVLVNFFASWCVPCQQEQADLVRFQNHHQATDDAVVYAVRFDDPDLPAIRKLMDQSGARFPVVEALDANIQWGVTGPPESFLVDPNGIVLAHIVGKVNGGALDALLGQAKAVEAPPTSVSPSGQASVPASGSPSGPASVPASGASG